MLISQQAKIIGAVLALSWSAWANTALADDTGSASPDITISGTAGITSQYVFRGIGRSNGEPALEGSITLDSPTGFYLATWGSSTYDNRSAGALSGASNQSPIGPGGTEIDIYGGYAHALASSGITLDGGLYGWVFPNQPATDFWETYGDISKSYGPIAAKVGLNWAPQQHVFDTTASHYSMYEYGELSFSPPSVPALTLHGHIGHTGGGEDYFGHPYDDFSAGAAYRWKYLVLDINLIATTITHADAASIQSTALYGTQEYWFRPAKTVGVATLTASF